MAPTRSAAPRGTTRPARRCAVVAIGLLLALAGCGGASDPSATEPTESAGSAAPTVPAADATTTSPTQERSEPASILDGWVSYELADGWEVGSEAEGLGALRDDFDTAPGAVQLDALEPLLQLERSDRRASVSLLREPAFLDSPDVDRWAERLVEDLGTYSPIEPVSDEPVELAHGPARRQVFDSGEEMVVLATTAYGEQRLALLARSDAELTTEETEQLDEVIASITLTPDVVITPLLQYHAGLVGFDVAGERAAEIGLHVPSDWSATDRPDGASYQSGDGDVVVDFTFTESAPVASEDVMRDLLAQRTDRDPLLSGDERELGGGTFLVARHGPEDLTEVDLGTSWVLVGQVPGLIVTIELEDLGPEPDAPLLRRIIDSLVVEDP